MNQDITKEAQKLIDDIATYSPKKETGNQHEFTQEELYDLLDGIDVLDSRDTPKEKTSDPRLKVDWNEIANDAAKEQHDDDYSDTFYILLQTVINCRKFSPTKEHHVLIENMLHDVFKLRYIYTQRGKL